MGSLDIVLDIPTIPRLLRRLLESGGQWVEVPVVENSTDRAYAEKAVEALRQQGLIELEGDRLRIVESASNGKTINSIIRFYTDADKVVRRRLLFRGILNSTQYACMIHVQTLVELMETEGFGRDDSEELIRTDEERGYLERRKIVYRTREGLQHRVFSFIPLHYYPHFITMKSEDTSRLKERLRDAGITMAEEDYLLGHYPEEIAGQSREYVKRENELIREKIKNEAFDAWWYYRF
jgi:hypothetical protein